MNHSHPPHFILLYPDEFTPQEVQWAQDQIQNDPNERASLDSLLRIRDVFDETLNFEDHINQTPQSSVVLNEGQKQVLLKMARQQHYDSSSSQGNQALKWMRHPALWMVTTALGCLFLFIQTQPSSSPTSSFPSMRL